MTTAKQHNELRTALTLLREAEAAFAPEYAAMIAAQKALAAWQSANRPANGWPRDWRGIQRIEYPEHLLLAETAAYQALRAKRREVGYFEAVRRYDSAHCAMNFEGRRKEYGRE